MALDDTVSGAAHRGTATQVFAAFLKLGVTSFGGPIAHLGYFRHEFVTRRKWLEEPSYADIVALCQFLPGPASSQVGITIGLLRAGLAGRSLPSRSSRKRSGAWHKACARIAHASHSQSARPY